MHLNRINNSCKKAIHRHSTIYAGSHSLMTGLQMDEHIARIALNQGATPQVKTYLTDALGSVIATAKADQSLEVGYAFSPYGQTQKVGVENQQPGSENNSQYTGRENDNNGLYFYRARYYDPVLKRFISEDPIGLAGGINSHGYVESNPVSNIDPTGLIKLSGNWCGPDWTGGKEEQYSSTRQYKSPNSYTDEACKRHDICFATCRESYPCDPDARKACMKMCNDDLLRANRFDSSSGASVVTAAAIWFFIGQWPIDPGPNGKCDICPVPPPKPK